MPPYKNLVILAIRCMRFLHLCPTSFQNAYFKVHFRISETVLHVRTFVVEPALLHFHVVKSVCDFSLTKAMIDLGDIQMSFAKEFYILPHFQFASWQIVTLKTFQSFSIITSFHK